MNLRMIVTGIVLMAGTGCVSAPPTIAHAHIGHAVSGVQAAIDAAEEAGQDLLLPTGEFTVGNLRFPGGIRIIGRARATVLVDPQALWIAGGF